MTDLTSARPVDLDWQDDETSRREDMLDHEMRYFVLLGAGLMACVPVAFCVAAARAMGWF